MRKEEGNPRGKSSKEHKISLSQVTNVVFGLRNDVVYHLLTPHFFVWFVEWSELIYHHLIPYS
jgi:hypothetical protein